MNPVAQEHLQDWASRLDFSDPYKVCVCDPSIPLYFTSLHVAVPNYTVSLGRRALYCSTVYFSFMYVYVYVAGAAG
jgi:hypothetical protein